MLNVSISFANLLMWILVGGLAGWLASLVVRGGGLGLVGDILVGVIGAFLGGFLLSQVFPSLYAFTGGFTGFSIGSLIVAFIGAVVLLLITRCSRPAGTYDSVVARGAARNDHSIFLADRCVDRCRRFPCRRSIRHVDITSSARRCAMESHANDPLEQSPAPTAPIARPRQSRPWNPLSRRPTCRRSSRSSRTAPIWPSGIAVCPTRATTAVRATNPAVARSLGRRAGSADHVSGPGLVEALMITRVILKLLAANPEAGFVRFIYNVSAPLVAPFQGIFPTPATQNSVLELSSLVAIAVYAVIAWGLVRLIAIFGRRQARLIARLQDCGLAPDHPSQHVYPARRRKEARGGARRRTDARGDAGRDTGAMREQRPDGEAEYWQLRRREGWRRHIDPRTRGSRRERQEQMRVLRFVVNTTDGLVVRLLSAPDSIARRSQLQGQPAVGGLIHGPEEPIPCIRRSRRGS